MKKVLGLVVARAGSKGCVGKNVRTICGKTVARYAMEYAARLKQLDTVAISTDIPALWNVAEELGITVVKRPPEYAKDTTMIFEVIDHATRELGYHDWVSVIYGNVPIRPDGLSDLAINMMRTGKFSRIDSVSKCGKFHPFWCRTLDGEGNLDKFHNNYIARRQELPPMYFLDGGCFVHAFDGAGLKAGGVVSPGPVLDIDTEEDFLLAEAIIEKQQKETRRMIALKYGRPLS